MLQIKTVKPLLVNLKSKGSGSLTFIWENNIIHANVFVGQVQNLNLHLTKLINQADKVITTVINQAGMGNNFCQTRLE